MNSTQVAADATPQLHPHPLVALLGRYATVFQACWQARHELAGPQRLADERAFLPAALSLQETPPHPAPRRAAFAICALFVIALAWACLGELDVVAVAQGRVIVGERTKLIQPLETAVVRAIHVRDGDHVEAGQLLVELDPTAQQADATRVGEERDAALSDALRAEALLGAMASGVEPRLPPSPPAPLPQGARGARQNTPSPLRGEGWGRSGDFEPHAASPLSDSGLQAGVRTASEGDLGRASVPVRPDRSPHPQPLSPQGRGEQAAIQLQAEWQDHRAKLAKLQAEQARRSAELGTATEVLAKLQATVPLARQREADYKQLAEQGFMSGHAGQDRARERIELERDLATAQARVTEAQAALAESQRSEAAYQAEARRTWQDRAAQARLKLAELTQEHTKASQRSRQTLLTAPVAGTVQQLAIHTPGGVVTPAQALMVIVPSNEQAELIAEVSIENKDIGFVQAGQHAEVKLETFNFTRYGTVPATVQWVTADAVVQPLASSGKSDDASEHKASQAANQAVFPARLVLARGDIAIDGKTVRLSPGLNLTAEIKTGKRRVIDYLLSPLQQRVGESLRER